MQESFEHPILQLLRTGSLSDIQLGMGKAEVLNITGDPAAISPTRRKRPNDNQILLFGDQGKINLQLAIEDGQLSGIWFYFRQSLDTSTLPDWLLPDEFPFNANTTFEEVSECIRRLGLTWQRDIKLCSDDQMTMLLHSAPVHLIWSSDPDEFYAIRFFALNRG